jgi:hypothetical protein
MTAGKKASLIIMTDGEASDGDITGDNVILPHLLLSHLISYQYFLRNFF